MSLQIIRATNEDISGKKYTDPRWQKKRLEILSRDDWQCVACGDDSTALHVHHFFYHGELWETPNECLQTLCEPCHSVIGPHPKGGVYYKRESEPDFFGKGQQYDYLCLVFEHCPICGCKKINHEKCKKDWRAVFECLHIPEFPEKYHWINVGAGDGKITLYEFQQ